jgi:5-(aminomethyl)-3-furanmethanol phosphate kinase
MGAPAKRLTVVKLGGSYALSPRLPAILAAIRASHAPVVVVPGGGPFADAVREAQPRMEFGDRAAHRMALLAMAQFAEALASLGDDFRVAPDVAAIRAALADGMTPAWSPWPMADGLEALPQSWDLTSDSLAAWLAGKLGAGRLILLKHRDPPDDGMSLAQAAEMGIVDPLFPVYATKTDLCENGDPVASGPLSHRVRGYNLSKVQNPSPPPSPYGRGGDPSSRQNVPSAHWLGPAQLGALTAILDGRADAGVPLHPALPA